MGLIMTHDSSGTGDLLDRLRGGEQEVLAELFARRRDRLRRMVRLRLDRRLQGRIDPSDVLQEAYLDLSKRAAEYLADPRLPFFLWLRLLTGQRLLAMHRQHLGAHMRDAGLEVSIHRGALPQATSASPAAQLLGHLTSPTQAAIRAALQIKLQERSTAWTRSTGRSSCYGTSRN